MQGVVATLEHNWKVKVDLKEKHESVGHSSLLM